MLTKIFITVESFGKLRFRDVAKDGLFIIFMILIGSALRYVLATL
jgi:hypothetical protein